MRLHLKLESGKQLVPFNYQPQLTGAIHKWLGENDWHDALSLYTFSWLQGGRKIGNGLVFDHGASLKISAHNPDFIKNLIKGIQSTPNLSFGLRVTDITIQETPAFSGKEVFHVSSPVLIKRSIEGKDIHYTYDNPACSTLLSETLKNKLRIAGLSDDQIKISFQSDYPGAQTKLIYYNNIGNRVNICPVIIEGKPEQIAFAWNVGIGNSTGIGFGSLR